MTPRETIAHRLCDLMGDEWSLGKNLYRREADAILTAIRERMTNEKQREEYAAMIGRHVPVGKRKCYETAQGIALVIGLALDPTAPLEERR